MKELSIQEKALRYDKAIKEASIAYKDEDKHLKATLERIFPELKESEGERIRKELLEHCKNQAKPYIQTGNKYPQIQSWISWLEKQGEHPENYDEAEKEKYDFVSGQFIECKKSFNEFKEDNSYWLEYVGNDTYIGRSDNILNKKFHITPRQLYRLFTQQHCPKEDNANEETNAPTGYGKYVDECLYEAATHFYSKGEDKYSVADLFYAGVRCGKSWLEKQGQTFTKKDVDDAYLKGVCDAKQELEKQGEQNPYSGVSFEYNGHAWGMCARDGGVEIAIDSELKAFVSLDKSFVYPNRPQKILVSQSVHEAVKEEKADNANKVEPKFKIGNWYQCTKDFFGKGVTFDKNTAYYCAKEGCLQDEYGCHIAIVKDLYDNFKLWDISDAKDGDVLVAKGEYFKEYIFIYSKMTDDNVISTHCGYDVIRNNFDTRLTRFGRMEDFEAVHLATKEQRDQLEKAMTDARYTFDFDKKELKKIEPEPENFKRQLMDEITDLVTDYIQQKPAEWSEEDEDYLLDVNAAVDDNFAAGYAEKLRNWLKSLKERVGNFDDGYKVGFSAAKHNQWKPSEEQIEALVRCVDYLEESDNEDLLVMESLLEQLKSLK